MPTQPDQRVRALPVARPLCAARGPLADRLRHGLSGHRRHEAQRRAAARDAAEDAYEDRSSAAGLKSCEYTRRSGTVDCVCSSVFRAAFQVG